MNIHFKDTELFESLKKATIHRAVVGSTLYGTNHVDSDVDYLYIYIPSISERNTFYPSHHQLQFKEKYTDHNFVNIFTFLRNCLNGDSCVNFEAIHHEPIKSSVLGFLWDMRHSFYNYKILRSYNGFAKRDIREIPKQTSDLDKNKKLAHAFRGHLFSKMILTKNLIPTLPEYLKEEIRKIKILENDRERKNITDQLAFDIEEFRKQISALYDSKNFPLPSFMKVDDQILLDKHLNALINSELWKEKSNWDMNLKCFYEVNENTDIRYT